MIPQALINIDEMSRHFDYSERNKQLHRLRSADYLVYVLRTLDLISMDTCMACSMFFKQHLPITTGAPFPKS